MFIQGKGIKHITGMLNNYTRFNFFFIFKFSFGGKKDVVCNIKRKSVNTFKYSHGYSLISFSSYSREDAKFEHYRSVKLNFSRLDFV